MKNEKMLAHPSAYLYRLSFKELVRNRFGLALLIFIPVFFLVVVEWTSGTGNLPIDLFYKNETRQVMLSYHDINVVFIGAAVSGFLTAYYAILLFHRNFEYYRHCIGMGLSPIGFLTSRFLFFLTVTGFLALLVSLVIIQLTEVESVGYLFLGFLMVGIIYGAFGSIMGLLSRDIMGAILGVVLLANLDAGWLQNPLFYTSSQQIEFIQWLPAFYPTQAIFAAAFTSETNSWAFLMSSLYAAVFLSIMVLIIRLKLRSVKLWWKQ